MHFGNAPNPHALQSARGEACYHELNISRSQGLERGGFLCLLTLKE
jgi:hypothetical protein